MAAEPKPTPAHRARDIFLDALDVTPPERAAFVVAACAGDALLRERVEDLLREQEEVGTFLETPAHAGPRSTIRLGTSGDADRTAALTEKPGDRIGRYKLLQKIGEGGCGVVYMAEQEEPVRRRVALKIIKMGMDTKSVIARFEAERQALALMEHPNIAKVFDAGATETGRPYFVMELVRGIKITEYCDQNHLPTAERLSLFMRTCQAIQHAHQKGIIHRDIKPSNILVTLHDGVPVPKVIDFGIAKATEQRLTEKTLFTEFTAFIGTPAYMSPEQAEMSGLDIDTRSDIYSLGVLLYELLTGKTPFDAETLFRAGLDECRRTIREQEPVRPSTRVATLLQADLTTTASQRRTDAPKLVHLLRGDLDWIVMKCLEKDRTRRYDAANDVAADVRRYLENDPVLARPPSNVYRLKKLLTRHRGAVAATAAIAVTLVLGAGLSIWQAVRATRAEHAAQRSQQQESGLRQQAEKEEALARLNEYVANMNLAQQSLSAGNLGRAMQLLEKHTPSPGQRDLRGFAWRYLWQLCQGDEHTVLPEQDGTATSIAVSPDGELLALGFRDKVNLWNPRTKTLLKTLPKGGLSTAFLPDGKTLLTASSGTVRLWNTADWTERDALEDNAAPFALSADGQRLVTSSREGLQVWNTANWKELLLLTNASAPMAFSPDGQRLISDSRAGLTVWPLEGGGREIVLADSTNLFGRTLSFSRYGRALMFSPDGQSVIAPRNMLSDRGVFIVGLWDARTGEETAVMPDDVEHIEHTSGISALAFSPDGKTLATASLDHSIRLWDFASRQRVATLQGHLSEVWAVAFSPDGQTVISAAKDGAVKLWPVRARPKEAKEDLVPGSWQPLAFSRDGRTLAALNRQGSVTFFNAATREPDQVFPLETNRLRLSASVSLSEDLRTLAQGQEDGTVKIWNTENHDTLVLKVSERPVDTVVLSPDGRTLLTGGRFHNLRCWDIRGGTNVTLSGDAQKVFFSPDGRTIAAVQRSGMFMSIIGPGGPGGAGGPWLGQTNRLVIRERGDRDRGDREREPVNTVQLWDTATRQLRTNLMLEFSPGFEAAFSPDGRILAVTGQDDAIHLLDAVTGRELGVCTGHKQTVYSVAFSPDGETLATASDDSTLKLWNVDSQQELLSVRRLGGALRGLTFSPDGRLLVGGNSSTVQTGGLRFYRAALFSETDRKR